MTLGRDDPDRLVFILMSHIRSWSIIMDLTICFMIISGYDHVSLMIVHVVNTIILAGLHGDLGELLCNCAESSYKLSD